MIKIFNLDLDVVTVFGIVTIIVAFLYFWINRKLASVQQAAPSILITLGIFFTFLGIAYGLIQFSVDDIDKSLPDLLAGIKTAFLASVCGVFGALLFKIREIYIGVKSASNVVPDGQTIDDLVINQLLQQEQLLKLNKTMTLIHASLAGVEDSSLVALTKLMRVDNSENFAGLRSDFKNFAHELAKNNTEEFIKALNDVIRDFNNKITEQFGDNFKQLNLAVGKTVEWQENYKNQMVDSITAFNEISVGLSKQSKDYQVVVENSSTFTKHAESMGNIMTTIKQQENQISELVKSLSNMVESVSKDLPNVSKHTTEMVDSVKTSSGELMRTLTETSKNLRTEVSAMAGEMLTGVQSSSVEILKSLQSASDEVKSQVVALDKALETELKNALESLGSQLASLSNKFVQDYTPLTTELQRLVQITKDLR